MTATTLASRRSRRRHLDAVVVASATVLGLWFGLGAPAVSPVAPSATVITAEAPAGAKVQAPITVINTVDHRHGGNGHGEHR